MAEKVECFITIVTGAPGHGKTHRTIEELELYILTDKNNGREGRKVIIFDTNNEFSKYQTVKYDVSDKTDNGKYIRLCQNIQIRRIAPFLPNSAGMSFEQKEKTLLDIMANYRNGLILLEDINTYLISAKSVETISFLCNNRHRGIDTIIHFQSLSAVEPRFFQNARILRMHYQTDPIERYRQKVPNFECVKIAQIMINHQYFMGNKYYCLYVDIRAGKITKPTDKQQLEKFLQNFRLATKEYITKFDKAQLRQKMQELGMRTQAKKEENYQKALDALINEKVYLYL